MGRIVLPFFEGFARRSSTVADKNDGGQVGTLDLCSDQIFREEFSQAYPKATVLSEECPFAWPSLDEEIWLIDPFDGTDNFLGGTLLVGAMGTHIVGGEIVASFVLLPFYHALSSLLYHPGAKMVESVYVAARGEGAFAINRIGELRRIHVDATQRIDEAFVLLEGSSLNLGASPGANSLMCSARRCRATLGAGLSAVLVADGAANPRGVSALAAFNNEPWDNLPAMSLVTEAGGKVTDHNGNPITISNYADMLASNGCIHSDALRVISGQ